MRTKMGKWYSICFIYSFVFTVSFNITALNRAKAILNFETLKIPDNGGSKAANKLQKDACLNVLTFGGSVTCGMSLERRHDAPNGVNDAYGARLRELLNAELPCVGGSGHQVNVQCQGGVTTQFWIERFSVDKSLIEWADVVFAETSVNDVEELVRGGGSALHAKFNDSGGKVKAHTEILINLILSHPNPPYIVYLGVSSRVMWTGGARTTDGDSVWDQLAVTKAYGITHVSIIDGIGPFDNDEKKSWFLNVYLTDSCCHVTRYGHLLISQFALDVILRNYLTLKTVSSTKSDKLPLFVSQSMLKMYRSGRPVYIDAVHDTIRCNTTLLTDGTPAWRAYEDVPRKPGLISTEVGSRVVFVFNAKELPHPQGSVHVQILKSYAHSGSAKIDVFTGCLDVGDAPITSTVVDCEWGVRVSEIVTEEMTFVPPSLPTCIRVSVTVVESNPRRESKKVKIVGITVF